MIYRRFEFCRKAIFWLDKDWDMCKVLSIYLSKNNILSTNNAQTWKENYFDCVDVEEF